MPLCNDIIKHRIIHFKRGSEPDIAERAAQLLSAVEGISKARIRDQHSLAIHYDIRSLSLQMIENALTDVGFELSDNLVCKVKRQLIAYCEDNLRETLDIIEQDASADKHEQVEQTAHDPRPYNWRNYS